MPAFRDWQLREGNRLCLRGTPALSPSELLAFVLRDRQTADNLLTEFRSLWEMSEASAEELKNVKGVNGGRAEQLMCCFELARRIRASDSDYKRRVKGPEDVVALIGGELQYGDREVFKEILLNTKKGVIQVITVAIGTLDAVLIHPREILKPAIRCSAAGIIIVHNHPAGDPAPSAEDVDFTDRLAECCKLIGIALVDHVIIGSDGHFCSLRERGIFSS